MCTVSFIPAKNRVFLTSNRDEQYTRRPALPPRSYSFARTEMVFPRDGAAGGSWICLCSCGHAGVLLNGAFRPHAKKDRYRKSRGLVFLDIMDSNTPLQRFLTAPFSGIEPFTLILWQQNSLFECRWDEDEHKYCRNLPANRPYIWSSSTLYDQDARMKREVWFSRWLDRQASPTLEEVLRFHRFAGEGDPGNDLFMNREGQLMTVSITGMELSPGGGIMHYTDTRKGQSTSTALSFIDHELAA